MTASATRPPRRWRPTPLLQLSAVVHAVALGGLLIQPAHWAIALSALAINHLILTAAGLWPRSTLLGPNWTRLPAAAAARQEIAITIDDGPNPDVTPAVLELLAAHQARATFFCIGTQAERHPELVAEILRHGHEIENHSQHHRHTFSLLGPAGFAREISAGQATLQRLTGRLPQFFRCPAGLRNPFLEPVLARHGLHLASWTRRGFDTRETDSKKVLRGSPLDWRPATSCCSTTVTRRAAQRAAGRSSFDVLPPLLDACAARGLRPTLLSETLK